MSRTEPTSVSGERRGPACSAFKRTANLLLPGLLLLGLLGAANAQTYQSTPQYSGFRDFSYAGSGAPAAPTAATPESKLWYLNGFWWGVLWDPAGGNSTIHRFDINTQNWTNTGTVVDNRAESSVDVGSAGLTLFILSHAKQTIPAGKLEQAVLLRYSYNAGTLSYTLDSGFPIIIPNTVKTNAMTFARGTNGRFWITWTDNNNVRVIHSDPFDPSVWRTPYTLPVQGNTLDPNDVSALVSLNGKMGVLWSNMNDQQLYFATHDDDSLDTQWFPRETVIAGTGALADNQFNIAKRTSDATIVAASKTKLAGASDVVIYLSKRDPGTGAWSNFPVWQTPEMPSMPAVLHDDTSDNIYVFARSDASNPRAIYMKSTSLATPSFAPGQGTLFMSSFADPQIDDPTTTKQSVNLSTGMVLLASDKTTSYYLHGFKDFNNQRPVATADNGTTDEQASVVIPVTANDTDPDGTIVVTSVTIVKNPANGAVSVNGTTGDVTYTPSPGFFGDDSFYYTVSDDDGDFAIAGLVDIHVNALPIAVDDNSNTLQNTPVTIDVTANDNDPDGTINKASVVLQTPANGGATVDVNGIVTYTPNTGFTGTDTFTYTVDDDGGATSNVATVSVSVSSTNQNPVANDDSGTTTVGVAVAIDVTANDTDPDGTINKGSVAIQTLPSNGGTSINPTTGVVTYTPDGGFSGTDTFTYTVDDNNGATSNVATVTVTVNTVNQAPVANDDAATTTLATAVTIDVTANDSDPDGTLNKASVALQQPGNGGVTADVNGIVTYAPNSGFTGTDVFTYTVDDNLGLTSNVATVTVTVNAVNQPPVANDDAGNTTTGTPVAINVTDNDTDPDGTINVASVAVQTPPANGGASPNSSGVVTYTPTAGFTGTDTFTYTVDDNLGATSNVATVTVTVSAPNQPPVANDDFATTLAGAAVAIDVTANDNDPDGTINVSTVALQQPANGGAVVNGSGIVTYTPNGGFTGTDTFTYTVDDNLGATSNVATVTVTVSAPNQPPVANDDFATTLAGAAVAIDVTANDNDPDGTINVSTVALQQPANGGAVVNGSGIVTYTPNGGFTGTDTFTYTVDDNQGATSNVATVTVTVNGGSQTLTFQPTDDNMVKLTAEGTNFGARSTMKVESGLFVSYLKFTVGGLGGAVQSATLRLKVGDGAGDGSSSGGQVKAASNNFSNGSGPWTEGSLTAGNAPNTIGGVLSTVGAVVPNQIVDFDVTAAVSGNGTFSFCLSSTSSDQVKYFTKEGLISPALIVQTSGGGGGNLPPVANNDFATTLAGTPVNIDVTANDTDPDGTINKGSVALQQPANGAASVNSSGIVTYTPNGGFTGTDTFTYTVDDNLGATSNVATVTVTVNGGGGGQTLTFQPTDDNMVKLTTPGKNFGTRPTAKVESGRFNSYFKFAVSGLTGPVQSAKVKLWVTDSSPDGGDIYSVSNNFSGTSTPWTEGAITASNAPTISGPPLGSLGAVTAGSFVEVDVTPAVSSGGTYSFGISTTSGDQSIYHTKEGANPPVLTVVTGSGGGNLPPVAVDDFATTLAGSIVHIDVTANDSDPDGTINKATVALQQPANGFATVNANGIVTYTPNGGFTGTDTFTYTVDDNLGATSNVATVTVTVNGAGNLPPVANDDFATTLAGTPVNIDVTANDSDPDGTINKATVALQQPANGAATVDGSGIVTYTPNGGFTGTDTFTYTVDDNLGATSNVATVTVTVNGGGGGQTLTFQPTDDNMVKLTAEGTNFGARSTMKVESGLFVSYLKFTVGGLGGAVQSATLRLKVGDGAGDGSSSGGQVKAASNNFSNGSGPWTEGSLTAGNAPNTIGGVLSTVGAVVPNQIVNFDVTAAVSGNGTFSFCLSSTSSDQVKYFTKEGLISPALIVQTSGGGGGNLPPVANNDFATTLAGTPVNIDVTANDTDPDGTINKGSVALQQPANGAASVNSSGIVTYTPNGGFTGTDTFTYTVDDNLGATSNVATVTVTVNGAGNLPPVANDDAATTLAGTPVNIDVTANDSDPDGTINKASVALQQPANGAASVNSSGIVTYTPNGGFTGTDTFTYTVDDNLGATSNVATVTVTVNGGGGGQTLTFQPTDDNMVKLTTPGQNFGARSTAKVESGRFEAYFKFVVSGLTGPVQSAKVKLSVTDSSPDGGDIYLVSNNFSGSSTPWTEGAITASNAPAISGAPLGSLGAVTAGTFVEVDVTPAISGDGTYSFGISTTSGDQSIYHTKEGTNPPELTVVTGSGGGNLPPVAVDDNASAVTATGVAIDVTANDSDPDGTINKATVALQQPANGAATVDGSGIVTYTSNAGFTGTDTFTYTVDDNLGATSNVATVTVTVSGAGNLPPVANDDAATTLAGTPVNIDVTANDSDPDGTINKASVALQQPANGAASVNSNGIVTYTPNGGFTGTDTFTYTVEDNLGAISNVATVTVTVNGGGGGQTLTFQPTDDNMVKLTTPGKNFGTRPTAKVESGRFNSYFKFAVSGLTGPVQSAKVKLWVTDSSPDGGDIYSVSNNFSGTSTPWTEGAITASNAPTISGPPLGSLGAVTAGSFVEVDVTPAVSSGGTYSFGISTTSGDQSIYHTKEGANPPVLTVVTGSGGGNLPPVANDDAATTLAGTAVNIDVTANDTDPDGTINKATVALQQPANGGATANSNGIVTYTPNGGFTGTDTFTYTVDDNLGATSNVATVTVTVNGAGNLPPVAVDDNAAAVTATAVTIDVTANDSDPDGTINKGTVALQQPANGAASVDANGLVTYTSNAGFTGTDTFTYTVDDNLGATSNVATVTVTVTSSVPTTLTFNPSDDSFVRQTRPTNNYGQGIELRVKGSSISAYNTYLKFNVSGVTGTVQSAKLRLYCFNGSPDGGSVYIVSNNYQASSTPWVEDGIVWDNAPAIFGTAVGSFGPVTAGSYFEVDVTAAISGDGIISFGIKSGSLDAVSYEPDEVTNRPELVIQSGVAPVLAKQEQMQEAESTTPEVLPEVATLRPNFPNPFNPATNIRYEMPEDAKVRLRIYNIRGQLVRDLVDVHEDAGFKTVRWEGKDQRGMRVSSGVYFIRLEIGKQKFTRQIVLQK